MKIINRVLFILWWPISLLLIAIYLFSIFPLLFIIYTIRWILTGKGNIEDTVFKVMDVILIDMSDYIVNKLNIEL
jgi:hypothetical protein